MVTDADESTTTTTTTPTLTPTPTTPDATEQLIGRHIANYRRHSVERIISSTLHSAVLLPASSKFANRNLSILNIQSAGQLCVSLCVCHDLQPHKRRQNRSRCRLRGERLTWSKGTMLDEGTCERRLAYTIKRRRCGLSLPLHVATCMYYACHGF